MINLWIVVEMEIKELKSKIDNLPLDEQKVIYKQLENLVNNMAIDIPKMWDSQKDSESKHCPDCQSS